MLATRLEQQQQQPQVVTAAPRRFRDPTWLDAIKQITVTRLRDSTACLPACLPGGLAAVAPSSLVLIGTYSVEV